MGKTDTGEQVETETGEVKWFDTKIGYGFIVPDSGDEDIFVHQSEIAVHGFRQLARGNRVEYELSGTGDGRKAHGVVILSTLDD